MSARFLAVVAAAFLIAGGPVDLFALRPGWRDSFRPMDAVQYPESNPYSAQKAALGASLFADPILSQNRTRSCASCHQPELAWGDGLARAVGDRQEAMELRSPTLLDVAYVPTLGWDGKFPDIEAVTFGAITGFSNMGISEKEALARLSANPAYVRRFAAVFGPGAITADKVEKAIATYVRGIASGPAPFDDWVAGDEAAVSAAAKRGFALFDGKAGCSGCHSGWAFSDYSFQDTGTATGDDFGRGKLFPTSVALRYAFKVPTLRSVALRAPYMHDGSVATLAAVVDLYDAGGIDRPSRSPKMRPLGLAPDEKDDLVAFLRTLTSRAPGPPAPIPAR